ncbi:MAG: hypothetical protein NTZ33_04215 [Bacteroidetes bacterium]|nr:hypothetical protein [Bacteroidota bacterium]
MKKTTNIFGGLTSLIIALAVIMKFQQIPGQNIMMLLGMGLLFPIFLILKGLLTFFETKSVFPIIAASFAILFNLGILFLILHYPGGYMIYYFSFTILMILLFVWYLTELFTNAEKRKVQLSTINLLIILCAVTFGFGNRGISNNVKNGMIQSNTNFEFVASELNEMNSKIIEQRDSNKTSSLMEFHKKTQTIIDKIEELKKELAIETNGGSPFRNYSEIRTITSSDISQRIMFDKGRANDVQSLLSDYYGYCNNVLKGNKLINKIDNFIEINQEYKSETGRMSWQYYTFYQMPVISSISNLSAIQVKIRLFENLVYRNM